MADFFVERQYWAHWPKVLLMCRKHGDGIERKRYVPDKGTCEVIGFDDGYDEGLDGEWFALAPATWFLSCDHEAHGRRPSYCPVCGRKVKED